MAFIAREFLFSVEIEHSVPECAPPESALPCFFQRDVGIMARHNCQRLERGSTFPAFFTLHRSMVQQNSEGTEDQIKLGQTTVRNKRSTSP